jgi:hypothetical protein
MRIKCMGMGVESRFHGMPTQCFVPGLRRADSSQKCVLVHMSKIATCGRVVAKRNPNHDVAIGLRDILYQTYDMRISLRNADLSECQKFHVYG